MVGKVKTKVESKVCLIRVNIKDKIIVLKDIVSTEKAPLNFIYKGEIISSNETFIDRDVKEMDRMLMVAGKPEMVIWKRFP